METPALHYGVTETRLGWAGVALSSTGIRYATLFHRTRDAAEGEVRSAGATAGGGPEIERALGLLRAYAAGENADLDAFPVDLPECQPFQRKVWLALREIPRGETRSYGWLARRVDAPEAARAVGAAVGANPIPLWLPCHRVVASDGSLHGFGGGLAMKQELLEIEGALPRRMLG